MGTVLVTGGAGYIGSHTVKALLAADREVVVLDNLSAGHRDSVQDVRLVEADVGDVDVVQSVLRDYNVTAVMHFAAVLSVGESVKDPQRYYSTNVVSTISLLQAMKEESVSHFIFSSSAAVYGAPTQLPIRESHPLVPVNPYGSSKLVIEQALQHYAHAYELSFISLRYFNAAGADPDGKIGEDHRPEIHVIPKAIVAAQEGLEFEIFGDDYATSDGTCVRDYVHVSDVADAHVLALRAIEGGVKSSVYNVGTGTPHSVRQVVASVERVTGKAVACAICDRRSGDPPVLYASSERFLSELGWKPRFGDIDEIVDTAWRWHLSHPNGYEASLDSRTSGPIKTL